MNHTMPDDIIMEAIQQKSLWLIISLILLSGFGQIIPVIPTQDEVIINELVASRVGMEQKSR